MKARMKNGCFALPVERKPVTGSGTEMDRYIIKEPDAKTQGR